MTKPAILTVDDDMDVLRAVERDLRREYGSEYRVVRADSGAAALEVLRELKRRGEPSALLLVDQRMPAMTGVEFLQRAIEIYPEAKRVLLTAYADTDAAIAAINEVHIDHYLLKPWDPPEERLYPVLKDLLDDWRSAYRPPFEGVRVVGNRWDPASHRVREFLARNSIPYLWMDPEVSAEARSLIEVSAKGKPELPCLFFEDGSILEKPEIREIAERCGLKTTADMPFYDLVIVGAGPAGLAAAVYGASEGLRTVVVERQAPGGQAGTSSRIENYLGFPSGVSGGELARRAVTQARRFGVEVLAAQEAVALSADGPSRTVRLGDGSELKSHAVVIATGVSYRQLEAEGIERLNGAGVYYGAALTEGESVRDQDVYIVGGANSAGQAAMYFSGFARTVTMLVRGDSLSSSMSQYLIDQIQANDRIRVRTGTEVLDVQGETRLERLLISSVDGQTSETASASALFIFIGAVPHTDWLGDIVARDEHGFILSGTDVVGHGAAARFGPQGRSPFPLETSLPGVFVAGDVRHGSVKRVASAVGEGSMAVVDVHRYLSRV
ncbi:MAG: FAD-dependent oxidoreductase [Gemmatimonadota bacterium]|nr:MAG: FAD-dependent oxidoreductase [Gemmatimonadota bacterium]